MAGASGEDRDIARAQLEFPAAIAAEPHPGMAADNAKGFVDRRVIMQIVVNAVAPRIAPAVGAEQVFDGFLRCVAEIDRALVDQERQGAVGNEAVVGKDEGRWLKVQADGWQNRAPWLRAGLTRAAAPRSRQVCLGRVGHIPLAPGPGISKTRQVVVACASKRPLESVIRASAVAARRPALSTRPSVRTAPVSWVMPRMKLTLNSSVV